MAGNKTARKNQHQKPAEALTGPHKGMQRVLHMGPTGKLKLVWRKVS